MQVSSKKGNVKMRRPQPVTELLRDIFGSDCTSQLAPEPNMAGQFQVFSGDAAKLHMGQQRHGRLVFVVVLDPLSKRRTRRSAIDEAHALVARLRRSDPEPLVFLVSPDPDLVIRDEFSFEQGHVFTIDENLISEAGRVTRFSALNLSIRQQLPTSQMSSLVVSPYVGQHPVVGSSFFGRRKELRRITDSTTSIAVVGARMVGKTSLLQEAARRLEEQGNDVISLDAQHISSTSDLVKLLVGALDPRERAHAIRRSKVFDEKMLRSALMTRLSRASGALTLIIDEMGNVLKSAPALDWGHFGVLRGLVSEHRIRIVFSCFEELFLKQQQDFQGPFVNMAEPMRLLMLSKSDVGSFITTPLSLLGQPEDTDEIVRLVWSNTGGHPLFLQQLGLYMFQEIATNDTAKPLDVARRAFSEDLHIVFRESIDSLFNRSTPPIARLVFLEAVNSAPSAEEVVGRSFGCEDIDRILKQQGIHCEMTGLNKILDTLEMFGLLVRTHADSQKYMVVSPLIHKYISSTDRASWVTKKLREETIESAEDWDITDIMEV